jgi:hypothetical protein
MRFLLITACVIVIGAVLAIWFDWKPIDTWRTAFRRWSTWLHGTGILSALAPYLGIWNQMPWVVQRAVPGELLLGIGLALWTAGALSVYVRQEKLHAPVA